VPSTFRGGDNFDTAKNKITEAGVQTASTSNVDFTGIPSWVKKITVSISRLSSTGTATIQIQLGAGGIETTGYVGGTAAIQGTNATGAAGSTTGIRLIATAVAATEYTGNVILTLNDAVTNTWVASGQLGTSTGLMYFTGSSKSLSGTLDSIRVTTTDTFDVGTINVFYEG